MDKVKFSVFSDLHLGRGVNGSGTSHYWCDGIDERLDVILERAKKENVDFIIHCGDFASNLELDKEGIEKYNNFEISTYHVLGNHDLDVSPLDEVVKCYKMPAEYYYFDKNGFRFVALNANYLRIDGEDVPYSEGNYYYHGKDRNYISREQLKWFEETVMTSPYPVITFAHAELSRVKGQADAWKNVDEFHNIIEEAHKNNKRVLMCFGGHYHVDRLLIQNHVCYMMVNSATMYWQPTVHHLFPEELHENHPGCQRCLIYNDPVHAVVTVYEDGKIEIDGMRSTFYNDVDLEKVCGKTHWDEVPVTPHVLSEKLWLPIEL